MENSTSQTPHAADGGSLRGRFSEATDEFVQVFTASIDFDQRLFREDIAGSIAHATMLETINVLTKAELDQIVAGLQTIQAEIEGGRLQWRVDLEDVHMNIEAHLTQRIFQIIISNVESLTKDNNSTKSQYNSIRQKNDCC